MRFLKFSLTSIMISSLIISCSDNDPFFPGGEDNGQGSSEVYTSLEDVFEPFADALTDTIAFDPTVANTLTGEQGVALTIPAGTCTGAGSDGNLYLILKEYLTLDDMFWGNAQTESNGNLLVTGGNFWWNVVDQDGNNATVSSYSIIAAIPVQTDITGYEYDMKYFVGQETTGGGQEIINWDTLGQGGEFGLSSDIFSIYGLELGWANCDALYNLAGDAPTQFSVGLTSNDITISDATVWMFIHDFPSVINIYTKEGDYYVTYDNSIPTGLNATLVAVGIDEDGYLMFGSLDITVVGDDVFEVEMDYGTSAELAGLAGSLVN